MELKFISGEILVIGDFNTILSLTVKRNLKSFLDSSSDEKTDSESADSASSDSEKEEPVVPSGPPSCNECPEFFNEFAQKFKIFTDRELVEVIF